MVSLPIFFDHEDDARHNNDVENSTSLTDAEDVPASDNTSCSSSPPEEESQVIQRARLLLTAFFETSNYATFGAAVQDITYLLIFCVVAIFSTPKKTIPRYVQVN